MELLVMIKKSNFARYSDLLLVLYPRKLNYLLYRCRTNPNIKFEYNPVELVMIREGSTTEYVKDYLKGTYHIYSMFIDKFDSNKILKYINEHGVLYVIKYLLLENYGFIEHVNPELDYVIKKEKLHIPFDEYDTYIVNKYKDEIEDYINEYLDTPLKGLVQNEFKSFIQYKNYLDFEDKYAIFRY